MADDELVEGQHPLGEHHGEVVHDLLDLQRKLRQERDARPKRATGVREHDGRVVNLVPVETAAAQAEAAEQKESEPPTDEVVIGPAKTAPLKRRTVSTPQGSKARSSKARARKRAPRKTAPEKEPATKEPAVELSALSPGERLAYEVASELGVEPEIDLAVPEVDVAEELGLRAPSTPSLELRLARLERHLSSVLNDLRDHQFRSQELARTLEERLSRIDEILGGGDG